MATAKSPFQAAGWVGLEGPRWLHSGFVYGRDGWEAGSPWDCQWVWGLMDSTVTVVRNPVLYT